MNCSLFVFFTILFIYFTINQASAAKCPVFGIRDSSPEYDLVNCTWFRSDSCCTEIDEANVFGRMPRLEASEECRHKMRINMCWVCSPYQSNWYSASNDAITICKNWCSELYSACKDAVIPFSGGKKVKETYEGATEFCEAQNYQVSDVEGNSRNSPCFNGANSLVALQWPIYFVMTLLIITIIV